MNRTTDLRDDAQNDPEGLEREIDQTRAEMDQTLGALEQKLSPGKLIDEALGLFREHGGDFASNLGNSIKQNPVPVMLAAVGIGWMIFTSNRQPPNYNYDPNDEESLAGVGESIKRKATEAGDKVKSGAAAARDQLANSWTSSKDAVVGRMSETANTAQAQARRAREGLNTLLQEQPIILGALGLAVGAAIGAVLPSTEHEDRLLGPVRDKTLSQIKERGAETYEQVRDTVENAVDRVQQTATKAAGQSGDQKRDREESNALAEKPSERVTGE
jgi:hypothetical protein